MGVSENNGTPKSSILIGFSIINHPFWGIPIFGNIHIYFVEMAPKIKTKITSSVNLVGDFNAIESNKNQIGSFFSGNGEH